MGNKKKKKNYFMKKSTKKVGLAGKYSCYYGNNIRKLINIRYIILQSSSPCLLCGKISVRVNDKGIWNCKICKLKFAGSDTHPGINISLNSLNNCYKHDS